MAVFARFRLDGVDDFIKVIAKLRKGRELRQVIRTTLRQAAQPVLATARAAAPDDTGALRRSIRIRAAKRSRRGIGVTVAPGSREQLGIPSSAKGYYPAHVALGTEHVEETRYLRDAVELEQAEAIETISDGVGRGIERIATTA